MVFTIGKKNMKSEQFMFFVVKRPVSILNFGRFGDRKDDNFDSYLLRGSFHK